MSLPSYEAGSAESYCAQKGWTTKRSGDQVNVKECPFCADANWKFYINDENGLWLCQKASCNRKGNFFMLQREMGDIASDMRALKFQRKEQAQPVKKLNPLSDLLPFEVALADDPDVLGYLAERGIAKETAQFWHLGVKVKDGKKFLMIPYLTSDGEHVADCKYRSLPPAPKSFFRKGGGESILFGEHLLKDVPAEQRTHLYLCEGEIDAITLWQHGFTPVLSTTTGAGSFKPRWFDIIQEYNPDTLIICYDSDAAGQKGAEALIKKFDDRKVLNIKIPDAKDANEFFQNGHTAADFTQLIVDAQPIEVENVFHISSVLDDLETQLYLGSSAFEGVPSQFEDINAMIAGGYWNGQLVTISGSAGTGKTTFALQELWWMAQKDWPAYMLCLEMPRVMMMRKLIEHVFHVPMLKQTHDDVKRFRPQLAKYPFYMGDKIGDLADVEKTIRAAVKRYDLKVLCFDNANFFVRSIEHVNQEIARFTKLMKTLAVDLNIPIIQIAQPRKFDDDTRVITMNDLKDSVAVSQDSDTVILLYRRRRKTDVKDVGKTSGFQGNQSPYTLVRVDKARYAAGGETMLYLSGDISTFRTLLPQERDALQKSETAA